MTPDREPKTRIDLSRKGLEGLILTVEAQRNAGNLHTSRELLDAVLNPSIQSELWQQIAAAQRDDDRVQLRIALAQLALQELVLVAAELKQPAAVIRTAFGMPPEKTRRISRVMGIFEKLNVTTLPPTTITGGPIDWQTEIAVTLAKIQARSFHRKEAVITLDQRQTQLLTINNKQVDIEEITEESVITSLTHLMAYMAVLTNNPQLLEQAIRIYEKVSEAKLSEQRLKDYQKWLQQLTATWSNPVSKLVGIYQRLVG